MLGPLLQFPFSKCFQSHDYHHWKIRCSDQLISPLTQMGPMVKIYLLVISYF